jgi:hypothetical protein
MQWFDSRGGDSVDLLSEENMKQAAERVARIMGAPLEPGQTTVLVFEDCTVVVTADEKGGHDWLFWPCQPVQVQNVYWPLPATKTGLDMQRVLVVGQAATGASTFVTNKRWYV